MKSFKESDFLNVGIERACANGESPEKWTFRLECSKTVFVSLDLFECFEISFGGPVTLSAQLIVCSMTRGINSFEIQAQDKTSVEARRRFDG